MVLDIILCWKSHPWSTDMTTVCYSNVYSVPTTAKSHKEIKSLEKGLPCWQKYFTFIIKKLKQNKKGSSWYQIIWTSNHMNLKSFAISFQLKLPYPCGKKHSTSWNCFQGRILMHMENALLSHQVKSCFLTGVTKFLLWLFKNV